MDNTLGSEPAAGINVQVCGAIEIANCDIIHFVNALAVVPSTGQQVASLWVHDSFFDTCTTHGINITPPAGTGTVYRCRFNNCWTSSTSGGIGFLINTGTGGTIDGIDVIGHHAFLNSSDGLQAVGAATTNVHILGGQFAQNGRDGIRFGSASVALTDFSAIGVRSGNSGGLTGNVGWGINVTLVGSNNYRILNNDLRGNTAGALQDTGVTPKVVSNNLGVSTYGTSTVATSKLTAQGAAITATTIYAVPATGAGFYRLSWVASVTTVGSVSSTLGGTNSFQVKYTDLNDNVVKTTNPSAVTNFVSAANTTGTTVAGIEHAYCAASTNLQYLFDYTSSLAGTMKYDLTIYVEYLG
jgi:hypothetical protein